MPEPALAGRGIVITRPLEQAGALAELIRQQHGRPILFPLLAIQPLDDYSAFDRVLDQLPHTDWAIFISTNAVEHGLPRLQQRYPNLPERLRFAGIGPTTAARLADFGIRQVLIPQERYDSEHLLALPEMQQVQGLRILLFRGTGGREVLADSLRARGAEVIPAECYRRSNPQQEAGELAGLWQNQHLHACVITSSEALRNLL
ncbi:MAG: uroporphyrinogen-III synthase, partial [Methylobacterium sp.]|nr:uroporphyrinogen-III synthase [Methylobacterium sp.]